MNDGPYRTPPQTRFYAGWGGSPFLSIGTGLAWFLTVPLWLVVLPFALVIALIRRVLPVYSSESTTGEEKAIATMRGWLRMPLWPWLAAAEELRDEGKDS